EDPHPIVVVERGDLGEGGVQGGDVGGELDLGVRVGGAAPQHPAGGPAGQADLLGVAVGDVALRVLGELHQQVGVGDPGAGGELGGGAGLVGRGGRGGVHGVGCSGSSGSGGPYGFTLLDSRVESSRATFFPR